MKLFAEDSVGQRCVENGGVVFGAHHILASATGCGYALMTDKQRAEVEAA